MHICLLLPIHSLLNRHLQLPSSILVQFLADLLSSFFVCCCHFAAPTNAHLQTFAAAVDAVGPFGHSWPYAPSDVQFIFLLDVKENTAFLSALLTKANAPG
jgi:hypothetical protein